MQRFLEDLDDNSGPLKNTLTKIELSYFTIITKTSSKWGVLRHPLTPNEHKSGVQYGIHGKRFIINRS